MEATVKDLSEWRLAIEKRQKEDDKLKALLADVMLKIQAIHDVLIMFKNAILALVKFVKWSSGPALVIYLWMNGHNPIEILKSFLGL